MCSKVRARVQNAKMARMRVQNGLRTQGKCGAGIEMWYTNFLPQFFWIMTEILFSDI